GMSPRNFARRFKQATGETPLGYLHELRIAAAKGLLEDDYRTIQEVSSAVGYDDVAFFRNLFKRHTGASPNDYRRRFGRTVAAE
ncbi:MAG: helix-turn-helix domain-containing protein, partial [Kiloniellales bacterium]